MRSEEVEMKIIKVTEHSNKKCTDCLNCKVSIISTKQNRLCYCSQAKKKKCFSLTYWVTKKVCKYFNDMSA